MELELAFDKQGGLLPVIVQEVGTREILMLAYVDPQALEQTRLTGKAHYYSRSKQRLWMKGESSGHIQLIQDILVDCDQDTLVYVVEQTGGTACHTGEKSCFFSRLTPQNTLEPTSEKRVSL
ncbi:MAG: phosphoribosyl-AMP cyclohydrolase [SAR324 cluster bacterium]|nr:phosphoribosyl-AMP cyclohydrolase [SAR324 cluster bacterium]MBF0351098.1 phosphoribosyl-AMP cyclohydrolase [SAR324 cluster bacterium]